MVRRAHQTHVKHGARGAPYITLQETKRHFMMTLPKIFLSSRDNRFSVVQSEPWMACDLEAIQRASFPDLAEHELAQERHYLAQMNAFPAGQHAILENATGKVVGSSSDLRVNLNLSHYQHKFLEAVGNNFFTTHVPDGDWLYGADIGVLPEFRGLGLASLLYARRQTLVRELGLMGHMAGAMPKGYGAFRHKLPIEEYVNAVITLELNDPVLSVQLRRGYRVFGIIPEYLEDASTDNYGVLILWRNVDRGW
jgi:GNAT superfamily N-acetyltransferase